MTDTASPHHTSKILERAVHKRDRVRALAAGEAALIQLLLVVLKQTTIVVGKVDLGVLVPLAARPTQSSAAPWIVIAACRSCGAPVVWQETVHGRLAPFNVADGRPMAERHFKPCPDAKHWCRQHGAARSSLLYGDGALPRTTCVFLGRAPSAVRAGRTRPSAGEQVDLCQISANMC